MSRIRLAIGLLVSVGLIAYLLTTVDLRQLAEQLRHTNPGLTLIGVALAPLGVWVRAWRWRFLFPPDNRPPGLGAAMMIGFMGNNVLPFRAGEIVRVYVVARRWRHGFWTVLGTVAVERLFDGLAIVSVLAVLALLIPVPPVFQWTALTLLVIDVVAVSALAVLAVAPDVARRLIARLALRWPTLDRRLTEGFDRFVSGLDGVRTPINVPPLLALTVLVWIMPALQGWVMLRAMNLDLPWLAGWVILAFVGLSVSVPSAPGYVGVFHYAAVLAVEVFGVPRSTAVGYALVLHASQIIPITLIGWLFLLREHVSLTTAAHVRPVEDEATPAR